MKDINIRPANINDFEEVFLLLKQLWPDYDLDKEAVKNIFLNNIETQRKYFFIVQIKDSIIGLISISIVNDFRHGKIAIIDEFIVTEKFRGHGIGKNMLNYVSFFSKEKGCKSLELHSNLKRTKTHRFYKRNGFEETSKYFKKRF